MRGQSSNYRCRDWQRKWQDLRGFVALHTLNPLTPNDLYERRTAQLTSRRCILYIYSTNMRTEYFKHAA